LRNIPKRQRQVVELIETLYDPKNIVETNDYIALKTKVQNGEDLTQHLSLKAQRKGYTPTSSQTRSDHWSDKDFLLNVMGFHHLHLKALPERTDDVVFAKVTRSEFIVIGFFNHDVFEPAEQVDDLLNTERKKLWELFDQHSKKNAPPNSIIIPSMISLSGHTVNMVLLAISQV